MALSPGNNLQRPTAAQLSYSLSFNAVHNSFKRAISSFDEGTLEGVSGAKPPPTTMAPSDQQFSHAPPPQLDLANGR
jgi:hypothetical protein